MQIHLSNETAQIASAKAAAAGFGDDVAGYLTALVAQDSPSPPGDDHARVEQELQEGFESGLAGGSLGEAAERLKHRIAAGRPQDEP